MHKREQIRRRAYEIWQAEGMPPSGELQHWLIAETEFDDDRKPAGPFRDFPRWAREPAAMQALSKRCRLLPQMRS